MQISMVSFLFLVLLGLGEAKKSSEYRGEKSELPFIACEVCRRAASALISSIDGIRKNAPYQRLEELEIVDTIDKICVPDQEPGAWIRELDIVSHEKGGETYVKLNAPGGVSKCETECMTISASCSNLFDEEIDRDDLSAALWKNKYTAGQFKV